MAHGGNVIDELAADHREVEELFARLESHPVGDPRRKDVVDRLTREIVRHVADEEQHFYPAVRRFVDDGDDMADKEIAEHAEVTRLVKDLESCGPDDSRFETLLSMLKTSVTTHVADEENRLFPLLAESCPADALDRLGEKIRASKA